MKRPTRVTRGSSLVTSLAAVGVGRVRRTSSGICRSRQLVVEAVAPLLEEDGPSAVELDGDRDQQHERRAGRSAPASRRSCRTAISSRRPNRRSAGRKCRAPARCRYRNRSAGGSAACWYARTSRMSTGSTQSFFSICRMRPSAEIGSEKITRSTRVWRANSTRSSTVPSLGTPSQVGAAALVAAVVEHADDAHVGIALRGKRPDQRFAVASGADHDGAAVEPALPRPAPHQQEQRAPERDQRDQAEHVEAAEPDARELIAGLGEERHADGDQKHHRPRRGEPHILLLMAAERLHLVDVGGLEGEHRQQRDADDGGDVVPGKAVDRNDVADIERKSDQRDQREIRSCGQSRRARSANRPA